MKPIFALQQVPHESLGTIDSALADAGLSSRTVELFRDVPGSLDLDSSAGLVVLGGPMNVDQTDRYPFLAAEVDWIRQAIERELPVLGICLGSQLIAKALDAKVYPNGQKEIGWYDVELTDAAADDPLMQGVDRRLPVFQWHGDTYDLPDGAVQLARSGQCENQAFRHGQRTYALQFHVEVTAAMVESWLDEPANRGELSTLDYITPAEIRRRLPEELPRMHAAGRPILDRFAALCREAR